MAGIDPSCFVEEEEVSSLEPMSCKWTDEKHSLYLKSMEASFVNQLYNSMDVFGWQSHEQHQSNPRSTNNVDVHNRTSGKFKGYPRGCWQNGNRYVGSPSGGGTEVVGSPSGGGTLDLASLPSSDNGLPMNFRGNKALAHGSCRQFSSNQLHRNSLNNDRGLSEVSDQNFVEEDAVERRGNRFHKAKRSRNNNQ